MVNPALALTAKAFDLKPIPRQVALSEEHLRAIWQAAEQLGEPWRSFFHMLLLSGQRRGEVAGMLWSELDLEREHVWVIPAIRMKAGRAHEVPLSAPMADLLKKLPRRGPYVFGRRLTDASIMRAKARLDAIIGSDLPTYVIHDIRRAVRTGLGALPSVPHDIRELCIGHVPPVLARTYDLHGYRDEKRQALNLWNERLARIIEPATDNVTALRRAGR